MSFLLMVILWTLVTFWSFKFSGISPSGTYWRSSSDITPRQLFKVLCMLTVTGMFASEVHFFSLLACKLVLTSINNSPDLSFFIFFGSPIIDSIALFIKKGEVLEKSSSFLLMMKKHAPSS